MATCLQRWVLSRHHLDPETVLAGRIGVVLRKRPGRPVISRWTAAGPSTDWFTLCAVLGILRPLLEWSRRQIKKVDGELGEAAEFLPEDFCRDFFWDEVVSKKADRALEMVRDEHFTCNKDDDCRGSSPLS